MTLEPLPGIYSAESLRKWLSKFAPTQEVGQPKDGTCCPASMWLKSEVGSGQVSYNSVQVDGELYQTPGWLRRFQLRIDALTGKVTARRALDALDAAERESHVPPPVHELAGEINRGK